MIYNSYHDDEILITVICSTLKTIILVCIVFSFIDNSATILFRQCTDYRFIQTGNKVQFIYNGRVSNAKVSNNCGIPISGQSPFL